MRYNYKKGFTLIELLVVIAIIGILSSVVLASLSSARSKGADAKIKSELSSIRAEAELFHDDPSKGDGSYGIAFTADDCAATTGTLFADPGVVALYTSAATTSAAVASCVSSGDAWAISVPMKDVPTNSWCVDSTGVSAQVTPVSGDRGFAPSVAACK